MTGHKLSSAKVWARDVSGSVMPLFMICIAAILALIGGTIALSMDSNSANNLQRTADSAALGGAIAFLNSDMPRVQDRLQAAETQAQSLADQNANHSLNDLNIGAVSEDIYGQKLEIAVEVQFKPVNATSGMTGRNANVDIRRRGVATATWGFPLCALALSTKESGIILRHQAVLKAPACIGWANSKRRNSIILRNKETTIRYLCAAGRARIGRRMNMDSFLSEYCDQIDDPMADWLPPKPGTCTRPTLFNPPARYLRQNGKPKKNGAKNCQNGNAGLDGNCGWGNDPDDDPDDPNDDPNDDIDDDDLIFGLFGTLEEAEDAGNVLKDFYHLSLVDNAPIEDYAQDRVFSVVTDTLVPGTYCGLDVAWGHVKMAPGIYFIKGAPMTVRRKASLTADGVSIIFVDEGAFLRVSDEARFNLTAPETGPTAGIALAEDRKTAKGTENMISRFTGQGKVSLVGLIYLPTQNFFFSGNGTGEQTSPLLQIVVNRLAMLNNSKLKIDFRPEQTSIPVLIEPRREARLIE